VGYTNTEAVAIKINLNNCTAYAAAGDSADASKQTILSTLRQLVNNAKVPQNKITVYDGIRAIPDRIYTPCHAEFPNVIWVDANGTNGRTKTVWSAAGTFTYSKTNAGNTIIPTCVVNATYIVNLPLLKGHEYSGITLCAKNHYGSLNARDHSNYLKVYLATTMPQYSMLVDILGTKQLGGKDLIYIVDALYANYTNTQANNKDRCGFSLFGGQWCASIFMSQDPVAMESVGLDFLYSEFGPVLGRRTRGATGTTPSINANNYIIEAALANNPPSKTVYKPDGTTLTSLGVYEHWNNATAKQYSRNLGTGTGIELYSVPVSGIVVNTIPQPSYVQKFAVSHISCNNGVVKFSIPQNVREGKLVIADMSGRTVAAGEFTSGAHEMNLVNSRVAAGAYIATVYSGVQVVAQQTIEVSK
jgi:hypothetical protein